MVDHCSLRNQGAEKCGTQWNSSLYTTVPMRCNFLYGPKNLSYSLFDWQTSCDRVVTSDRPCLLHIVVRPGSL